MAKPKKQDDYVRTALRVPPELHALLHRSAEATGRTFNAEIVSRLESSFVDRSKRPSREADDLINQIRESLNSVNRSVLPNENWADEDFEAWPGRTSVSDLALFFALLSHLNPTGAAELYESMLHRHGGETRDLFMSVVGPLLRYADPAPEHATGDANPKAKPETSVAHRKKAHR